MLPKFTGFYFNLKFYKLKRPDVYAASDRKSYNNHDERITLRTDLNEESKAKQMTQLDLNLKKCVGVTNLPRELFKCGTFTFRNVLLCGAEQRKRSRAAFLDEPFQC